MANENVEPQAPVTDPGSVVAQPVAIKDDDVVEIVYKGEKVLKPWKEARANIQMQEDYTRSKQELAAKAKEVQDIFDGLTARQKAIVEKEAALDRILGRQPTVTPDKPDPEEVMTRAQVDAAWAEREQKLRTDLQNTANKTIQEQAQAQMFSRWEEKTQDVVEALVKENPVLGKIPNLSTVLKSMAQDGKPNSEKEMFSLIAKAGAKLAKDLDDEYADRRKREIAAKKQMAEHAPLRPGGSPQFQPTNKTYEKKGSRSIDWDAVDADALAAIEGMSEE